VITTGAVRSPGAPEAVDAVGVIWPEVTERAFLAHKRTDRERDAEITEEIRQKTRMPVVGVMSHCRHPRQSPLGLAEGHNVLFSLEGQPAPFRPSPLMLQKWTVR
jgi:hypothetical protein